jgi:hypothetical protein
MTSTIKYPIQRVVNWYYGNFCTRKCFNKENRIAECQQKLQFFVNQNKNLMITHKEFKDMIDNDNIKICCLPRDFRKKTIGWNQFESWLRDPLFDPDKF